MESIRELRRLRGLSQVELAKRIGVHQTAISQWEKGRTSPDHQSLERLAAVFQVSFDELMGSESVKSKTSVPILGEIRAGLPVEAVEDVLGYEDISADMARSGVHFALRVKGDSMQPRFCEGDVVILRKQEDADSGDIVAAMVADSDATIKKLIKKDNGIVLMPLNPGYDPMVYSAEAVRDNPVRILGKVVELRARF